MFIPFHASCDQWLTIIERAILFHAAGEKRWAVQLHAPGQDSGLRKNSSGPLPLRQRTARKRPKQNNRALSPHVSFSFCPMCQATPERTSLGNLFGKDVAAKALYISILWDLSARFRVRKNQDLAHSQVISRHVLPRTR